MIEGNKEARSVALKGGKLMRLGGLGKSGARITGTATAADPADDAAHAA